MQGAHLVNYYTAYNICPLSNGSQQRFHNVFAAIKKENRLVIGSSAIQKRLKTFLFEADETDLMIRRLKNL